MPKMSIDLIDDEPVILRALSHWLMRRGFRVRCFENPDAALAALQEHEPKVVLTDWHMPNGGGERVISHLKQHHPHIPCGVMSAGLPHHAGASFFLRKPFKFEDLEQHLTPHLNR